LGRQKAARQQREQEQEIRNSNTHGTSKNVYRYASADLDGSAIRVGKRIF
jgi:hypothetical protein